MSVRLHWSLKNQKSFDQPRQIGSLHDMHLKNSASQIHSTSPNLLLILQLKPTSHLLQTSILMHRIFHQPHRFWTTGPHVPFFSLVKDRSYFSSRGGWPTLRQSPPHSLTHDKS